MRMTKDKKRSTMNPYEIVPDFDFEGVFDDSFGSPKKKKNKISDSNTYYIYGEVGSPDKYINLIHDLYSAEEGDEIVLRIASPGGDVDSMVAILHAMSQTEATVITVADSELASAATFLFLAGHIKVLYEHSSFMFHAASFGAYGKVQEVESLTSYMVRRYVKLAETYLFPYLTEEELDVLYKGSDIYMEADEMSERLSLVDGEEEV